jgi:hypothetical protein
MEGQAVLRRPSFPRFPHRGSGDLAASNVRVWTRLTAIATGPGKEALELRHTNSRASGVRDDDGPRKSPWNRMNEGTTHRGPVPAPEVEHRCET